MRFKLITIIIVSCLPRLALATLGENTASIVQDNQVLNNNLLKTSQAQRISYYKAPQLQHLAKYDISTMITSDGVVVKQFIRDGKVFAISWHGPRIPNLRQLYGVYFKDFIASTTINRGMHQRRVDGLDFTATVSGISGKLVGQALLKSQLPPSLALTDLH